MSQPIGYLQFAKENAPFLAVGFLLTFISGLGQTFFIAIFGSEIRAEFSLSNGDWGLIYMVSTGLSAAVMVYAGMLADRFRIKTLSALVIGTLSLACFALSLTQTIPILMAVVFLLRLAGQGMSSHMAMVAMSRWFVATRGRAIAIASLGFMFVEATMPLTMVWLKSYVDWRTLWVCFGCFAIALIPIIWLLLSKERTPSAASENSETLGMSNRHWTRKQAISHPLFWMIAPAVVLFPAFGTAFWFHQAHFAELKGWSHLALVSVFPLGTIALAFSTVAYGWLIDKFGAIKLLPFFLIPLVGAFILHWAATHIAVTAIAVILMGIAGGGQSTVLNACWAELYGTRNIGAIKAAAAALMVAGSAIGPGLTGYLVDIGFGFDQQQLVFAGLFAITCFGLTVPSKRALALSSEVDI